jgi:NADH-quinone oxidoreductase subunit M
MARRRGPGEPVSALPPLELLWALPLAGGALAGRLASPESARRAAVIVASATLALSLLCALPTDLASLVGRAQGGSHAAPAVDGLTAVLLPLVACTALASLAASPRAELDARAARDTLHVAAATMATLVSTHLLPLVLGWALSLFPLYTSARRSGDRRLAAALRLAALASSLPLAAGLSGAAVLAWRAGLASPLQLASLAAAPASIGWERLLGGLVLVAACARMGVFPLHFWLPTAVERARSAAALPALISPLGSFALVRLGVTLFPHAISEAAPALIALGAVSAAYGALAALGQHDLRRQLGYLLVSVAGFVLVGLASLTQQSMSGALLHEAAVLAGCSGLLLIATGIHARAGTADMRRLGGLVQRAPRMATGFFLLSAAVLGFPGTTTFVSEDLLIQGVLRISPPAAVALLVVTAVNGVTLLRSFKRVFLGPAAHHAPDLRRLEDLLPRERWVSLALVGALLVGGFVPTPLLRIREGIVDATHRLGQRPGP